MTGGCTVNETGLGAATPTDSVGWPNVGVATVRPTEVNKRVSIVGVPETGAAVFNEEAVKLCFMPTVGVPRTGTAVVNEEAVKTCAVSLLTLILIEAQESEPPNAPVSVTEAAPTA